jgi:hypothetical protein
VGDCLQRVWIYANGSLLKLEQKHRQYAVTASEVTSKEKQLGPTNDSPRGGAMTKEVMSNWQPAKAVK